MKTIVREFGKFSFVGLISTAINYGSFYVLYWFGIHYLLASIIGYCAGVLVGYALNRTWTFAGKGAKAIGREFIFYWIVYLVSLLLSTLFLFFLVDVLTLSAPLANILAIGLSTATNFIGLKWIVFHGDVRGRIERWQSRQNSWLPWCVHPLFIAVLVVKLIAGTLFGSDFLVKGFIPFVNYFVSSGFLNPYNFFVEQGFPEAFPYPTGMLAVFAISRFLFTPFVGTQWETVTLLHLFLMRLPLLLADILIYIILCRWLDTKQDLVLKLYWASPVLFFISYIHGQLDVLPTALLFLSLVFLFANRFPAAFAWLGIGLSTKTHLLAALPFYVIYLLVNRHGWKKALLGVLITLSVFGIILLPYLSSPGFIISVFGTSEAAKVFLVHVNYIHNNLVFLLAPGAILVLFLNFFPSKKLNKDAMLLILGLLFTVFTIFVPPMPGWFFWSIPFFVYFFAKYQNTPRASFWLFSLAYLGYFAINSEIPLLSYLQVIWPDILLAPPLHQWLSDVGVNIPLMTNSIFTVLVGAVVMNAIWIYRIGVRSNLEYAASDRPLIIGIGGDSGSGKNTLANLLRQVFGEQNTVCVEGDDAHRWERHDTNWKHYTHLNPKSNLLHRELHHTHVLKGGETVERTAYDHQTGKFTLPIHVEPRKTVLYVGLHPFYLSKMRSMFDIKIFLEPDEGLRRFWKIQRDHIERGHTIEEIEAQLKARKEDAEKYILPQKRFADVIFSLFPRGELINAKKEPPLGLRVACDNSIDVEPFLEAVSRCTTLSIDHSFNDDLHRQTIEFIGTILSEEIHRIAHELIPNLDELTFGVTPHFAHDHNGLRQLFILYYLSEMKKLLMEYAR